MPCVKAQQKHPKQQLHFQTPIHAQTRHGPCSHLISNAPLVPGFPVASNWYWCPAIIPFLLIQSPDKAFGSDPNSLGIIILRDLPDEYQAYRHSLLNLAYRFARLDHNVRESYSDPSSKYRYVHEHFRNPDLLLSLVTALAGPMARHVHSPLIHTGNKFFLGNYERQTRWVPNALLVRLPPISRISDTLKGSFYANPIVEEITVSDEERRQFPEYYGKNICMFGT